MQGDRWVVTQCAIRAPAPWKGRTGHPPTRHALASKQYSPTSAASRQNPSAGGAEVAWRAQVLDAPCRNKSAGRKPTNKLEKSSYIWLDIFLKFLKTQSDNTSNGTEKSEPGSGVVSDPVFREEPFITKLFEGSEVMHPGAQQAKV